MPLAEPLLKLWHASPRTVYRVPEMTLEGVMLGKTLLAPWRLGNLVIDRQRIITMLSVAYGGSVPLTVLKSFRYAGTAGSAATGCSQIRILH